MKDNLCEAMLRPCDAIRGGSECQMCQMTYLVKELRKIKDELKLLNTRLFPTPYKESDFSNTQTANTEWRGTHWYTPSDGQWQYPKKDE
jgi:hypothetical protein